MHVVQIVVTINSEPDHQDSCLTYSPGKVITDWYVFTTTGAMQFMQLDKERLTHGH